MHIRQTLRNGIAGLKLSTRVSLRDTVFKQGDVFPQKIIIIIIQYKMMHTERIILR